MKKLIVAVCALCLTFGSVNAQKVMEDNVEGTEQTKTTSGKSGESDNDVLKCGFGAEYQGIDGGFGMGFNLIYNHVMVGFSWLWGDTNDTVTKNDGWRVSLGYNYRYWLGKAVFIEGTAGFEYCHVSTEYKTQSTSGTRNSIPLAQQLSGSNRPKTEIRKDSNGDFGLFLYPRVGVKLGKVSGTDWGYICRLPLGFQQIQVF